MPPLARLLFSFTGRLSRQGWSEDEVDSVFPGQKPGEIASTTRA